jgi:hypothetical protein
LVKKLLISGCSYGLVYSEIQDDLKSTFGVDEVVNLSEAGASPDRQIRVVIEWIAQNGKPDMVMMPVSHYNRFDLPIAEKFDPLHNLHLKASWQADLLQRRNIEDKFKDTLKTFLKAGAILHEVEHTTHDYLFVKLITFQAYLQVNQIRHLIFDTGNYYEKLWIKYLSIDDENNSGYQPGMKKRDLIENCKGIYKLLSFCSNVWMYQQLSDEEKKSYIPYQEETPLAYPLDDNEQATIHHGPEMALKLIEHLTKEGAVYG